MNDEIDFPGTEANRKYLDKLEWLKKWGAFETNDEVSVYPWCMVDVMTIMEEYKNQCTKNLITATTILLENAECRGDEDCDHCVATQLLDYTITSSKQTGAKDE